MAANSAGLGDAEFCAYFFARGQILEAHTALTGRGTPSRVARRVRATSLTGSRTITEVALEWGGVALFQGTF